MPATCVSARALRSAACTISTKLCSPSLMTSTSIQAAALRNGGCASMLARAEGPPKTTRRDGSSSFNSRATATKNGNDHR